MDDATKQFIQDNSKYGPEQITESLLLHWIHNTVGSTLHPSDILQKKQDIRLEVAKAYYAL